MHFSDAYHALLDKGEDIDYFVSLHESETGTERGRRYGVEPLNRAMIVFICASWDAYCNDVIRDAAEILSERLDRPNDLPKPLAKAFANWVKSQKHDLKVFDLVGDGWRKLYRDFVDEKLEGFNTPKPSKLIDLFNKTLDIEDVTANWRWQKCNVEKARTRLDRFVTLRGEIAHRMRADAKVGKKDGRTFHNHVGLLAGKTDATVREHLITVTGYGWTEPE